jgi:hypothetical protein
LTIAAQYLSFLGFIFAIFGEEVGQYVTTATCHMHHGTLFAQVKSSGRGQHETNRLDKQRPLAQVTSNDEATQDALYLFVHKIADVSYINSTMHKHN